MDGVEVEKIDGVRINTVDCVIDTGGFKIDRLWASTGDKYRTKAEMRIIWL